jgi:hypothetical protein
MNMAKNRAKNKKKGKAASKSKKLARRRLGLKRRSTEVICGCCGGRLALPAKLTTNVLFKAKTPNLEQLEANAAEALATRVIKITATPTNASSFVVNFDGEQLGLAAGQPLNRAIAPGNHMLTAIVFGNPGASLTVSGTIPGQAGVNCRCSVDPAGNPGVDPEPFVVS